MTHEHHDHSKQGDLALARSALELGDHGHAAFHVACALAEDARDPEALDLADRVLRAAPDPAGLCPLEPGSYFGLVAFHARAAWHVGDRDRAVRLIGNVIAAAPDAGYATWLASWVGQVDEVLAVDGLERALGGLSQADPTGRQELLAAAEAAIATHPGDVAAATHVRALRGCGRMADALERAGEIDRAHRSYRTGVVLATTRRISGDLEGAVAQLRDVAARFPDDDAVLLDLGDNLIDLDRPDEAAAAYETVTARAPHHEWAHPSLLYARFLATGEARWRDELEDLAQVEGADRARSLARSITPYVGYLPSRHESILKIGEQLRQDPPDHVLSCAQSSLEAPSAVAAVQRLLAAHGGGLELTASVPEPDPREPRGPTWFATWRYDQVVASPAVPPPPDDARQAIAEIAHTRFDGREWCERAHETARGLGPGRVADVIAAMIHDPGPPPPWSSPFQWPWRMQVAGAMVLAQLDDGWESSVRRSALMALVEGPVDWLATAGLVALARLCERSPELVPAVTEILEQAAALPVTPIHHACLIEPAVELLTQLPGASPGQRAARRARRAELG